jgi:signal transduction histidine kinase
MFKSARLKLTLFYLAILVVFSFVVTFGVRVLAEQAYMDSNMAQRGTFRKLILNQFDLPAPYPDRAIITVQDDQAELVRDRLNHDLVMINVAALIIGGLCSWWIAGRTLRPIEEAHEAQARFASDASHELRTPLTNLKLENEVFLRQKSFTETEARAQIASNLEEVQRLEGLSSNLLALTQYGNTSLTLGPVPPKRVVEAAVAQADKAAKAKNVTFDIQVKNRRVIGHEDSLVQLLCILIDNAIKYGPQGGTVLIGGQPQDGNYIFWVQDQGAGIDEKDMPHIFDRLYRGDKARTSKEGGYGLGLSLAKAIADANNADIYAQNAEGGGASLAVRLPLAK